MPESEQKPGDIAVISRTSEDLPRADLSTTGIVRPLPAWAMAAHSLMLADHRSEETKRAYAGDLADFWRFAATITPDAGDLVNGVPTATAIRWLGSHESGPLAMILNGYKASLRDRSLSEATINRRLAAVRSLLRMARRLGAPCPDPAGLVQSEKVTHYRDTRGPELSAAVQLLQAPDRKTLAGQRDYALLLLLCENALRRGEVCRANVSDFEPGERRLQILGKGRGSQKEGITLSPETVSALTVYLQSRITVEGVISADSPLIASLGKGTRATDDRITGQGIALIVGKYGRKALGRSINAHSLRHMSITAILDATNGDVRTAQKLSRHRDLRTLAIYDDNRSDLQGAATNILSDLLKGKKNDGR